jgi:hypothetical protein
VSALLPLAAAAGTLAALAGLGALFCLAGAALAAAAAQRARLHDWGRPCASHTAAVEAARAAASSTRLWKGAVWFAVAATVWLALSVGLAILAGGVTP